MRNNMPLKRALVAQINDIWTPKQSPKVALGHSGEGLRDASAPKREISNPYSIYYVLSTSALSQTDDFGPFGHPKTTKKSSEKRT